MSKDYNHIVIFCGHHENSLKISNKTKLENFQMFEK